MSGIRALKGAQNAPLSLDPRRETVIVLPHEDNSDGRRGGPLTLFEADIRDRKGMDEAFASFRPEAICHLAARAGVRPSIEDPLLYEEVNCVGTLNLLQG